MGIVKKTTLESYFSDSHWLTTTTGWTQILSQRQYELIRAAIHFADNNNANLEDRLYKIRPILDIVQDLYTTIYSPNKELSIDETMLKFKGRLFFKQYMPKKPSAKWGIKVWSLCDSQTGYLCKFNVYTGKGDNSEAEGGQLGEKVVKSLLLPDYADKGHD